MECNYWFWRGSFDNTYTTKLVLWLPVLYCYTLIWIFLQPRWIFQNSKMLHKQFIELSKLVAFLHDLAQPKIERKMQFSVFLLRFPLTFPKSINANFWFPWTVWGKKYWKVPQSPELQAESTWNLSFWFFLSFPTVLDVFKKIPHTFLAKIMFNFFFLQKYVGGKVSAVTEWFTQLF